MFDMKDKKGKMSEQELQAKLEVLKELFEESSALLGNKVKGELDGLRSVKVTAKDDEGLAEGLDLAEDLAEQGLEDDEDEMEDQDEDSLDLASLVNQEDADDTEDMPVLEEETEVEEKPRKTKIKFY